MIDLFLNTNFAFINTKCRATLEKSRNLYFELSAIMNYSNKKELLLIFFLPVWLLLLFLLGETFLYIYLFFFFVAFTFIFSQDLNWKIVLKYKQILCLWILFLFFLVIASFTSLSLPLSIESFLFHLVAFLVFLFFLVLKRQILSRENLFLSLVFTSLILLILNLFFYFLPSQGELIPNTNLIFSSYGHNHIAAFLIIILPIFWVKALREKKTYFYFFLSIIFSLWLLFTHSRFALLLVIIELLIALAWFSKKKLNKYSKRIFFLYKLNFLFFIVILFLYLFINYFGEKSGVCRFSVLNKFCKTLKQEPRPFYWQQAIAAFFKRPLLGYGPGTFHLISRRFLQKINLYSAHAHNEFLEKLAELGVGGFIYWFLFFYIARFLFLGLKKADLQTKAISLSLIFSLIYSFFDFDWSFSSIYFLFFILLAFVLKSNGLAKSKKNESVNYLKCIFLFFRLVFILFFCLFFLVEIFLSFNKPNLAFEIFPYAYHQHLRFLNFSDLNKENHNELFQIYKNHSQILGKMEKNVETEKIKFRYRKAIIDNYKYGVLFKDNLNYSIKTDNIKEIIEELELIDNLYLTEKELSSSLSYSLSKKLAEEVLASADFLYQQNLFKEAGFYYELSVKIDPWAISRHYSAILENKIPNKIFIFSLKRINPELFGDKLEIYTQAMFNLLDSEQIINLEEYVQLTKLILQINPWRKYELWEKFSPRIVKLILLNCAQDDDQCTDYLLTKINPIIKFFDDETENWDYQTKRFLIKLYQKQAVDSLQKFQFNKVQILVEVMPKIDSYDYWSQVQLGNFYLSQAKWDLASKNFKKCMENFDYHPDCKKGLDLAENQIYGNEFLTIAKKITDY